jgi:hypothetical protein
MIEYITLAAQRNVKSKLVADLEELLMQPNARETIDRFLDRFFSLFFPVIIGVLLLVRIENLVISKRKKEEKKIEPVAKTNAASLPKSTNSPSRPREPQSSSLKLADDAKKTESQVRSSPKKVDVVIASAEKKQQSHEPSMKRPEQKKSSSPPPLGDEVRGRFVLSTFSSRIFALS